MFDCRRPFDAVKLLASCQASGLDPAFAYDPKRMAAACAERFAVDLEFDQRATWPPRTPQDRLVGKLACRGVLGEHEIPGSDRLDGGVPTIRPDQRSRGETVGGVAT